MYTAGGMCDMYTDKTSLKADREDWGEVTLTHTRKSLKKVMETLDTLENHQKSDGNA